MRATINNELNNNRITILEQTASKDRRRQEGGDIFVLQFSAKILLLFKYYICMALHVGFLTFAMHHYNETTKAINMMW